MNNLKTLITKLSQPTKTALEKSVNFCISQSHYEVEIEHLLCELLKEQSKTDLSILFAKYKISKSKFIDDLNNSLTTLSKGNTRTPIFTKSIILLLEQAWLLAAADQQPIIRSGHLIIALLTSADLYQVAIRASVIPPKNH